MNPHNATHAILACKHGTPEKVRSKYVQERIIEVVSVEDNELLNDGGVTKPSSVDETEHCVEKDHRVLTANWK